MDTVKQGNILNCTEEIIVHQVNVQGIMGGGVARQLALQYPSLEKEYSEFCALNHNDYNELKGQVFKIMLQGKLIMNMFSQKENFDTDYEMMKMALEEIKEYAKRFNLTVAIPYGIGCGIANGDWKKVYRIIQEVFIDYDVTLYRLER